MRAAPYGSSALVTFAVASAMHLDWHFARPEHHRLSLGWPEHWLAAIPVFMFTGWYVCRFWPRYVPTASVAIIGAAALLAQVVEPLWELLIDGATFEWAFGAERQAAFASFAAVGVVVHAVTVLLIRRRAPVGDRGLQP